MEKRYLWSHLIEVSLWKANIAVVGIDIMKNYSLLTFFINLFKIFILFVCISMNFSHGKKT